jgi:peptide/nickel transport system permease protein
MARVVDTVELTAPRARASEPSRSPVLRFMRRQPLGAAGLVLVLALIVTALLADALATHDPVRTSSNVLVAPNADFWLGTDNLGRDLYSRVIHGSRISLAIGIAPRCSGPCWAASSGSCPATWGARWTC